MRFKEFREADDLATAIGKAMVAGVGKDASDNNSDPATPAPAGSKSSNDVEQLQKDLKAAGADLGDYGLNKDGIDGIMGPVTRKAAAQFPEIAKKYKETLDKPDNVSHGNVDTSTIQDPNFNTKLKKVAGALGVEESDLRAIIKTESGFNPKAQDPFGVSAGLIGFTRQTAKSLGTSREEILNMSAVDQLDYVYKFYKMNNLRPGSDRGTMYMITFMPAYAYAPDDTVLGQQGGGTLGKTGLSMDKIWSQNPVFGKSRGKSFFTVGDVKDVISRK